MLRGKASGGFERALLIRLYETARQQLRMTLAFPDMVPVLAAASSDRSVAQVTAWVNSESDLPPEGNGTAFQR